MTDKVEQVARAIWDDACPGLEWDDIDRLTYIGWARAAIEAMREPTMAQLAAGQKAWLKDDLKRSSTLYTAMIDAALEGEK